MTIGYLGYSNIFQSVVRWPCWSVLEPPAYSDYANRKAVHDGPVANELIGAERREGGDRIREWEEPRFREAGSQPYHVLLGDADVEKLRRISLCEFFQDSVAEVRCEENNTRIVCG